MRDKSVLRKLLGLCVSAVVVCGQKLVEGGEGDRDRFDVWVRSSTTSVGRTRSTRRHWCDWCRRSVGSWMFR